MGTGILGAIARMGEINKGKDDREAQKMVKKIIIAMTEKKRKEWPDKELRAIVNGMDALQRKLFIDTLKDMDEAIDEAYAIIAEGVE